MDEESDAGDDQQHDERELIEGESEIDVKAGEGEPGIRAGFNVEAEERARSLRSRRHWTEHSQNEANGASRAMVVTSHLGSREPRIPFNRNPAKGSSGIKGPK